MSAAASAADVQVAVMHDVLLGAVGGAPVVGQLAAAV